MEFILNINANINKILEKKGLTRKYFVTQLLLLNPILKTTGEAPSSSTIYGYLSGNREVKIELLPYIAEVLDISIAELFEEEDKKSRLKTLKNILKSPSIEEQNILESYFKFEEKLHSEKMQSEANYHLYNYIYELLPYSSEKFLYSLIDVLESFKDSTKRAKEDINSL